MFFADGVAEGDVAKMVKVTQDAPPPLWIARRAVSWRVQAQVPAKFTTREDDLTIWLIGRC